MIRKEYISFEFAQVLNKLGFNLDMEEYYIGGWYAKDKFEYYGEYTGTVHTATKGEFFQSWHGYDFHYDEDVWDAAMNYEDKSPENTFFGYFFLAAPTIYEVNRWLDANYNLRVEPIRTSYGEYYYNVVCTEPDGYEIKNEYSRGVKFYDSYEEAMEFGMMFAVEHYILNK